MALTSSRIPHIPSDDYIPPELLELRGPITHDQFEQICSQYRDLRLELTSSGELTIMPPAGNQTGRRELNLTYQLETWARTDGTGVCFPSSAGFVLPSGAIRSPDASWVSREKWERLTEQEKERFSPFCPDFVVELTSPSDRLMPVRNKMLEYLENGASLGWLIDPFKRQVHVYRPGHEVVILENPATVSGEPLLPGFTLNLAELW